MKIKRCLSAAIIFVMFFPLLGLQASAVTEESRLSGDNRYDTAIKIAYSGWNEGSTNNAILATGEDFPDSLCAAPLSKKFNAPILLTGKSSLNTKTEDAIKELGIKNVYIMGGPSAVPENIEKQLKDDGINCIRVAGEDRYGTSIEAAKLLGKVSEIVLATGNDFPDALSVAPIAANEGMPIILTDKNSVPDVVKEYISQTDIQKTYVIGGTSVIRDQELSDIPKTERLYGNNRYETNTAILNKFTNELDFSITYLATGVNFPDALSGSSLAFKTSSPIILVGGSKLADSTKSFISSKAGSIDKVVALGGEKAIPASIISSLPPSNVLTYKDGVEAGEWAFSGLDFLKDPKTGMPHNGYNYSTQTADSTLGFNIGLASFSTYMATGDEKYLNMARKTADFLDSVLPETGIVPVYSLQNGNIDGDKPMRIGDIGQATALEYITYLAREDNEYIPLMNKLAEGIIKYGINPRNNLMWYQVSSTTGKAVPSPVFGYENQFGSSVSSAAEALLAAYETDPSHIEYKTKALDALKAVWECRNRSTNLISETWDIMNNTVGTRLYPYSEFRYDDMGGAYIRALTEAYAVTGDTAIYNILKTYASALTNAVWDTDLNGGAFRYLTKTDGTRGSTFTLEIMHGLFISTILEAEKVLGPGYSSLYEMAKKHADHVFLTDFGVKNYMLPHQVSSSGGYVNILSDSQLGYAALQYPLGYEMLSQMSGSPAYRLRDNQIINTLLERHKIGDNVKAPKGFINIVQTEPPYGFEMNYSTPEFMPQAFFIPSYILYNSIHPGGGVTIDWQHGLPPSVIGLVYNMPYWDLNKVRIKDRVLTLSSVSGKGTIDLKDMGFGDIVNVRCDGQIYTGFNESTLYTKDGTHKYEISWVR